jgi:hypothetical protein
LNALDRAGGGLISPERIDESVDRDHLVGVEQKQCNQQALLAAA